MTDFIESMREAQAELATRIASVLHEKLAEKFNAELDAATKAASLEDMKLDATLAREMLHDDLERDVFVALIGIGDWLGSHVFRAYPDADHHPQEVSVTLPSGALRAIAEKYHVDQELLAMVLKHLLRTGAELAPIGKVVDGLLQPNWDSLKKWASHYDWSS